MSDDRGGDGDADAPRTSNEGDGGGDTPRTSNEGDGGGGNIPRKTPDGAGGGADTPRTTADGDGQPTVTVGSEGFQPDGDAQHTTDAREDAGPAGDREFGRLGWLLVGVVVVCFLVLPVAVALRPVRTLGFWATYLVLPLVPAVVLGATAVWVAVRGRQ